MKQVLHLVVVVPDDGGSVFVEFSHQDGKAEPRASTRIFRGADELVRWYRQRLLQAGVVGGVVEGSEGGE